MDGVAEPSGPAWTPERRSVRRLLATQASPLVATYEAALVMLDDPSFPARRMLIAHCVREIMNSLPWYFEGAEKGTVSYTALDRIYGPWRDAGLPIGEQALPIPIENASPEASESVQVPGAIVHEIAKLLNDHKSANGRSRRNAEIIFQGLDPVGGPRAHYQTPTLKLWLETRDWFVKSVHHSRLQSGDNGLELDGELYAMFGQFERVLGTLAQPFLEIVNSLDEDLVQANS